MRLAVIGSREWKDKDFIWKWLDKNALPLHTTDAEGLVIVSGGARGVDTSAAIWADTHRVDKIVLPCTSADWQKYGKIAGHLRNRKVVETADRVVAFWNGVSGGTANAIAWAVAKNIPVQVLLEEGG